MTNSNCMQENTNNTMSNVKIKFCPNCGAKMDISDEFCGNCGRSTDNMCERGSEEKLKTNEKRNKNWKIIAISGLTLVILTGAAAIVMHINNSNKSDIASDETFTQEPQTTASAEPNLTEAGGYMDQISDLDDETNYQLNANDRVDVYNSSLTYKRMNEIHSTSLTDDDTFFEIKDVISYFCMDCEKYMNESGEIPVHLRPGSTAYRQQTEYKEKHPGLKQTYIQIDVINTREGSGYYYAWVSETLNVTENGETRIGTDHWVYKLSKVGTEWYIEDYTRDPAY